MVQARHVEDGLGAIAIGPGIYTMTMVLRKCAKSQTKEGGGGGAPVVGQLLNSVYLKTLGFFVGDDESVREARPNELVDLIYGVGHDI